MELKTEINETVNNTNGQDESERISAENLAFLELLLTDKKEKVKEYEKAKKNIQELISSESGNPKKFISLVKLVLKAEVPIVKGFFEQEWQNLSTENQNLAINELLTLPSEKGLIRQITVARLMAPKNGDTAAKIIFHILAGGKQNPAAYDFSLISKDKRNILQNRFFPPNGTWLPLSSSDQRIFRTLVLFFSDLAEEVKDFGKPSKGKSGIRLEMEFAGWMKDSLEKLDLDTESLSKIESRLNRLINGFPTPVQEQLKQKSAPSNNSAAPIARAPLPYDAPQVAAVPQAKTEEPLEKTTFQKDLAFNARELEPGEGQSHEVKKPESPSQEISRKKDPPKTSDLSAPEQLLKEKQNALSKLSSEIEVLSKLIAERDSLLTKQRDLQKRLDSAYDETERVESKLKDLRRNFDETEAALTKVTHERDKALSFQKQLTADLSETKTQLRQASQALESERSEFAQSSKQEVVFELESFKGDLKQKLRSIFENKRQTDDLANNEKLAEFLRDQFTEIENVLKKAGINP